MKTRQKAGRSFRKLFIRFLHHPVILSSLLVVTLFQVGLTVYLPILIGRAIDAVITPHALESLQGILFQMILVVALTAVCQWVTPILSNRLIFEMIQGMRQEVFEKIHRLPLAYLDRQSVGDIVARFSSDSEQLTTGLNMIFNQFLIGVLTIFLTIFTMARLDWMMMGVVVLLTPLSLFVARFIAQKSYRLYRHQTQARGDQAKLLEESISQLDLIQSFNAQSQFQEAFFETNQTYAQYSQEAIFASSTINPSTRFINALIYALLTALGAVRIMAGNFTVGALTTFLNYANQYTKPFNDISSVLSELQSALACAERLFTLIEQEGIKENGGMDLSAEEVRGHIQFDQVSFAYQKDHPLIQDLTLDIPAGSKVAIVGPTGAGKSTMINLLMRFYEVNQGQILLDGVPIVHYSRDVLRKQIGMVLQETWLKEGMIAENIAYGYPNATRELIEEAAKAANADFFIRQLKDGYDTYLADSGASLSVGQRQLLAIARVFVKVPNILILDEATSSIDTRTEVLIQEAFQNLMKGRTSFVIAHRLSTIQDADLILVMVDGHIAEQGNHESLMEQKGVYYQMQWSQGYLAHSD